MLLPIRRTTATANSIQATTRREKLIAEPQSSGTGTSAHCSYYSTPLDARRGCTACRIEAHEYNLPTGSDCTGRPSSPGQTLMAARKGSGRREFPQSEKVGARAWFAHGVRIGAVPKHRRVLEPSHRHVHAAG